MDLQTGLLCLAIAVGSAVVLYVISLSTMKTKSFDEAKAEQKRKNEEHFSHGRVAKDKVKDSKKQKKAGKKVKEKSMEPDEARTIGEGKGGHVEFEEPAASFLTEPPQKTKKVSVVATKPILIKKNKPATLPASMESVPPPNHFDKILPKDDLELKRSHNHEDIEVKTGPAETQSDLVPAKTRPKPVVVPLKQQVVVALEQRPRSASKPKDAEKQYSQPKAEPLVPLKTADKVAKTEDFKKKVETAAANGAIVGDVNVATLQTNAVVAIESGVPAAVRVSKKKKNELAALQQISGGREGVNINLLMPLVRKAELSRSEVQNLIETLLNKQQDSSDASAEWIEGRQDPMVRLKRQLAEKEKALSDEQEAGAGLQAKLKELRAELNGERSGVRRLEEAMAAREDEGQAVLAKLQRAETERQGFLHQLHQVEGKLTEEHLLVRNLNDELSQTQAAMQQELLAQRQPLELHIARITEQHQESIVSLESQLSQVSVTLQEQEAINSSLSAELVLLRDRNAMLQDTAREVEELRRSHSELSHILASTQFEGNRIQGELKSTSDVLAQKQRDVDQLGSLVQSLQAENQRLREENQKLTLEVSTACVEARQLRDVNESLAAQVTERPATEGRENGDVAYEDKHSLSFHLDHEEMVREKDRMVEQLSAERQVKDHLIEELTAELATYKRTVSSAQTQLQALGDEACELRNKVNSLTAELASKDALRGKVTDDLCADVTRLTHQLDEQRRKNDDLRTKNWKVMEALSATEKTLGSKVKESQRLVRDNVQSAILNEQSATKLFLLRIFPNVTVENNKDYRSWLESLETAVRVCNSSSSSKPGPRGDQRAETPSPSEDHAGMLAEMGKHNSQLQAMVTHYKAIIADTEGMLNRLQNHVEQEESRWGLELQALEAQLEAVVLERDNLLQLTSTQVVSGGN